MERFGLGPALLERVLARLGLAVQLVLALFMVLLVAPDLAALLHLGVCRPSDERDEGDPSTNHVCGVARRSDSRAVGVSRAAHHHLVGGPGLRPRARPGCGGARLCFTSAPRSTRLGAAACAQIYVPRYRLSSGKILGNQRFFDVAPLASFQTLFKLLKPSITSL